MTVFLCHRHEDIIVITLLPCIEFPRRRELLSLLDVQFSTITPAIDEIWQQGEAPEDYVIRLARRNLKRGYVKRQMTIRY